MPSAGKHEVNTWEVWGAQRLALCLMFHLNRISGTELESFEVLSHTKEHSELVEDFFPGEWNVTLAFL
jgi:hypothetical protein